MNRLRHWLFGELEARIAALEAAYSEVRDQRRETIAALAETITELNALRNAQAETFRPAEPEIRNARRYPNWSATRAALEGKAIPGSPQPIAHKRKTVNVNR